MYSSFQTLAIFGLAAVNAAPIAQQQSIDWQATWSAEMASMEAVQSRMGHPATASTTCTSSASASSSPAAVVAGPSSVQSVPSVPAAATTVPTAAATSAPSSAAVVASSAASSAAAPAVTGSSSSGSRGAGAKVTNNLACTNLDTSSGPTAQDGNYQCFTPDLAANFPSVDKWASFDSLWTDNAKLIANACTNLGDGADTTTDQAAMIKTSILQVAKDSLVDPRFILAITMQESHGCVNVGTTSNGVTNPGLMQSHNGKSFDASNPAGSITQMIIDGTQGTASGDGLVQLLNQYGDYFTAARAYNSGSPAGVHLNAANGATASYVEDIANRLLGWSYTPGTSPVCPGEA